MTLEQKKAISDFESRKLVPFLFKEERTTLIEHIVNRSAPNWGGFEIRFFDYKL
jgi:hypothetical protein